MLMLLLAMIRCWQRSVVGNGLLLTMICGFLQALIASSAPRELRSFKEENAVKA